MFCGERRPPTEEHIFPEAIGGRLITNEVCKLCNSYLGAKVDAPLVDHALIVAKRSQYGLSGKKGREPDVMTDVLREGTLVDDPDHKVRVKKDSATGQYRVETIYSSKTIVDEEGKTIKQIRLDESKSGDLSKIIQRERGRAGLAPLDQDELRREVEKLRAGVATIDNPTASFKLLVDLKKFHAGLLKITYELAFRWYGRTWVKDPAARRMANLIRGKWSPARAQLLGSITFGVHPVFHLWPNEPNAHLAISVRVGNRIALAVRVFDTFSAGFLITNDASRYVGADDSGFGQFLSFDARDGIGRESSLPAELARLSLSSRPILGSDESDSSG